MTIGPEDPSFAGTVLLVFLDATVKATIVLTLALLANHQLKHASSAVRHRVWALSSSVLIVLPALSWFAPGWRVAVWVDRTDPMIRPSAVPLPADPPPVESPRPTEPIKQVVSKPNSVPSPSHRDPKSVPSPLGGIRGVSWAAGLVGLWAVGFLVVVAPTLAAMVGNEWRRLRSRRVDDPRWLELLGPIRRQLAIRRRVGLRFGEGSVMPMTWGIVRPLILLPNDAQTWPEPTRRVVLLHELAHVARFDVGYQLLGRFAAALYWFHPLAWLAVRRMRVECEHACDDRVLEAGVSPSDYADQLLSLARAFRASRFSMGLAMARTNTLESRMIALFDASRSHAPLPRATARNLGLAAALLLVVLGFVHPGRSVARPEQTPTIVEKPAQEGKPAPEVKGRIEGRVVLDSDGRPSETAKVVLYLPRPQGQIGNRIKVPLITQVVDRNGGFTFEGMAAGRYSIWACRDALSSKTRISDSRIVEVVDAGADPTPIELRLKPGLTWKVRVKDRATGKPIQGATAHLRGFPDDAITDAEGVALVRPLTADLYHIEVWAEGFARVDRTVDLADGGDSEAEVLLDPGGNIAGVVRDSTGHLLAQILVLVTSPRSPLVIARVESDENGRYRVEHLPVDGSLDIHLIRQGSKDLKQVIQVQPVEQTFDFTLGPRTDGGSVAGVVVDAEGHPIAGANVSNRGDNPGDLLEATTGPDGRFVLDNLYTSERPEGKVIRVQAKSMAPELIKVTPGPPDKPAEIKVTLTPGHRIKGRVLDGKNQPLSGVRVNVSNATTRTWRDETDSQLTDAEGRFLFDTLPPKSAFNFSKRGYPFFSKGLLPLDGEATVDVVLNPAGQITGRVVDASTGRPISRFNVLMNFSRRRLAGDPSGSLSSYLTDPGKSFVSTEGEFQLKDLTLGMPFQVTILVPGFEEAVADRVVAVAPDAPRVEEFHLTRLDPANLENYAGRLLDQAGGPVAGADVVLIASRKLAPGEPPLENAPIDWNVIRQWPRNRHPLVTRLLTAVTDGQGRFSFAQVPKNGEVELAWWGSAVAPGRRKQLEKLDSAEKANVEVPVFPPSRIEVTFDRQKYSTAAQVTFVDEDQDARDLQNRPIPTPTGFAIGNLAAGTYLVSLRPAQRPDPNRSNAYLRTEPLASRKVTVGPGETARVEFRD